MDTIGELYDSDGHKLVANDNSRDGLNFFLVINVKAGSYYLKVNENDQATGSYQIVSSLQTGAQADDYGNTQATASLISPNSDTSGNLEVSGDEDFFRIDIVAPSSGILRVWTTGETDTIGELLDSDGQILENNDDGGDVPNFSLIQRVAAGTYFVRIQEYEGGIGSYKIFSSFQADAVADDHGNTQATASVISPTSKTSGNLEVSGDEDFFRIDILSPNPGILRVWTTGETDTIGELFNSAGQKMVENDDSADDVNFSLIQNVSVGTYYVVVQNYGNSTGSYQIVSSFAPTSDPPISAEDPVITRFDVSRGQLTFTEVPRARSYRVEWSATMAPGSWSHESPGVAVIYASGAVEQTVAIGIIPPPCFFRVVAVLER